MAEQISISHSCFVHLGCGGKAGFASRGHLRCRQRDASLSQHNARKRELKSHMPQLQWLRLEINRSLALNCESELSQGPTYGRRTENEHHLTM